MGLLNNLLPFSLIVWGQTQIDAGLAAILNATTPLFSVLIAHWFTQDERITGGRLAGIVLGLGGVVLLVGPEALRGLSGSVLGQLAVVGASLSYAIAGVYGRRHERFSPLQFSAGMLSATALLSLPLALLLEQPLSAAPSMPAVGAVVGLALLSSAVAYLLYFRILARAGVTNVLLVTMLIPVSALILGAIFLGERPAPGTFPGMALILAGLLTVDGRVLTRWRRS
jgi:drug/metabolite transporter (DMT)-like permease